MLRLVVLASALAALANGKDLHAVTLATFDSASGTTFKWSDMNDPVMGGASKSTFSVEDGQGHFSGTCAIVPFLKAPGFCKISTSSGWFSHNKFADVRTRGKEIGMVAPRPGGVVLLGRWRMMMMLW